VVVCGAGAIPEPDLLVFSDLAASGAPVLLRTPAGADVATVVAR
jgi:hypothetical protein